MIPTATTRTRLAPVARPLVPVLEVGIDPASTSQWWTLHGGASASGARVTYTDLYAFLWYSGKSGFETRPGPGAKIGRYMRGLEDNDERKVR
ncbi:hypothetical protein [Meiothermus cerbereus]|uniref:hypothetical protein n=1 Tax=Meiothermus cerbereus TaxID=65552 RepID=UPI003EF0564C